MSHPDLDSREMLLTSLGHVLGLPDTTEATIPVPKLLSKRWWVFQVPSKTTPRYRHLVVGSVRRGWECSCVGWQSSGTCYHVRAVAGALKMIADERHASRHTKRRRKQTDRRGKR